MQQGCTVKVYGDEKLTTIEVVGDLTTSAETAMNDAYQKAYSHNPQNILLKFDGKSRINSAGIAIVINLAIENQGKESKIFITGVSNHFRKIFELVGLTKYTTIVDSEAEVNKS